MYCYLIFIVPGHTRQGLKCRVCKLNVHVDCQEKVGRCQPKSRLLRRQKSTSEIETRVQEPLPDEESEYSPHPQLPIDYSINAIQQDDLHD